MSKRRGFLSGAAIDPKQIKGDMTVAELVDSAFLAYNAARLREACQLFVEKMLQEDVTIGMSLTGALTPAGLGMSAVIPLIENGFVDWIVSTGATSITILTSALASRCEEAATRFRISCCAR